MLRPSSLSARSQSDLKDSRVPVSSQADLEELKWLRGGVLALHAIVQVAGTLDRDAAGRVDWAGVAYLTDQMQAVSLGALDRVRRAMESGKDVREVAA